MLDLAQGVTRDPHLLSPSGFKNNEPKSPCPRNHKELLTSLKPSPARERWDPVHKLDLPPDLEGKTSRSDGVRVRESQGGAGLAGHPSGGIFVLRQFRCGG